MLNSFNARVLVIDDEETIRDSFKHILTPKPKNEHELNELASAANELFSDLQAEGVSDKPAHSPVISFELDEASTGQEGFYLVQKACNESRPYAAIFLDMRMPGWDGLETAVHIRKIDERAEIIFVTAYSDHSIENIITQAGQNVNYHCKPFSNEEIFQLATKATFEWNKAASLEELIKVISQLRAQHWQLNALLENVLHQVASMLNCKSALLVLKREDKYEIYSAIGILKDPEIAYARLKSLPANLTDMFETENMLLFTIEKYNILTIFDKGESHVQREHIYLVKLFLEQAAAAIKNIDLQAALLEKEKLSAVGQSLSMLSHDLRNYLGAVIIGSELLEEQISQNCEAITTLKLIRESSQKGLLMVDDVLDFINNKPVEKELLELKSFLASIRAIVSPVISKCNSRLDINCPVNVSFMGHDSKLERVIVNLIRNAAEAMQTSNTPNPYILLETSVSDTGIQIKVSDNGPGIPDKIRDTIFKPFVTSGKKGGSGLGLAISEQFVKAHGGTLDFESSLDGTTFIIAIPKK